MCSHEKVIAKANLEVGLIIGSILVILLMCSETHSKVVLRLGGAILNAFCANMGSISHIIGEIEIFRKCAKIRSVSGECFAPICVHVSRRHVLSVISRPHGSLSECLGIFEFFDMS